MDWRKLTATLALAGTLIPSPATAQQNLAMCNVEYNGYDRREENVDLQHHIRSGLHTAYQVLKFYGFQLNAPDSSCVPLRFETIFDELTKIGPEEITTAEQEPKLSGDLLADAEHIMKKQRDLAEAVKASIQDSYDGPIAELYTDLVEDVQRRTDYRGMAASDTVVVQPYATLRDAVTECQTYNSEGDLEACVDGAFAKLFLHEIGHTLGLPHPDRFYDADLQQSHVPTPNAMTYGPPIKNQHGVYVATFSDVQLDLMEKALTPGTAYHEILRRLDGDEKWNALREQWRSDGLYEEQTKGATAGLSPVDRYVGFEGYIQKRAEFEELLDRVEDHSKN